MDEQVGFDDNKGGNVMIGMKVSEACIGCGVCVRVCKHSVLRLECKTTMGLRRCFCVVSNQENCTECGRCIEECLVRALTFNGAMK